LIAVTFVPIVRPDAVRPTKRMSNQPACRAAASGPEPGFGITLASSRRVGPTEATPANAASPAVMAQALTAPVAPSPVIIVSP